MTDKKKGFIYYLITALVVVAVICAGAFFIRSLYVNVYGQYMFRSEKTLDLKNRGISHTSQIYRLKSLGYLDLEGNQITPDQYDSLVQSYPGCVIRWDVPFSFGTVSNSAEAITPSSLTDSDIAMLSYLADLSYINLSSADINDSEYEKVKAAVPNCTVVWETVISGKIYPLYIS